MNQSKRMRNSILAMHQESGRIVFITEVPKGLSCNCICPDCGKPFLAAQGEKNEWHFRHHEETHCGGGQETALHLMAKDIIVSSSRISLRGYGSITYENPQTEKPFQGITPDVSAKTDGKDLFFEIQVTHAVDKAKETFYKDGEYKSIEIDLKNYTATAREDLAQEVLRNDSNKRIIFWEKKKVAVAASRDYSWVWWIVIAVLTYFGVKWLSKQKRTYSY